MIRTRNLLSQGYQRNTLEFGNCQVTLLLSHILMTSYGPFLILHAWEKEKALDWVGTGRNTPKGGHTTPHVYTEKQRWL
jgi:hypothetical protein